MAGALRGRALPLPAICSYERWARPSARPAQRRASSATIVRVVLVPATMVLLGNANWWLPRRLDRILPKMDLEGTETLEAVQTPTREPEELTV
ncbi:MAG: hypothetical protein GEU68_03385 [Actinobacteria bacterium]|nr:hypothetical protein [Actinomycetota bacterium]